MATHFSDIGFKIKDNKAFADLTHVVSAAPTETWDIKEGSYMMKSFDSGVQLWLHLNEDKEIIGFVPHFVGESVTEIVLTNSYEGNNRTLDGSFHGWMNGNVNKPDAGTFPLVFDVPNYYTVSPLNKSRLAKVQLTAFADDIFTSRDDLPIKLANHAFIPSGLFAAKENKGPPKAEAIISGEVITCDTITNDLTKDDFYSLYVKTLGTNIDMVADPALFSQLPQIGDIIQGQFWLSGLILPTPNKQK